MNIHARPTILGVRIGVRIHYFATTVLALAIIVLTSTRLATQAKDSVRLNNSDWWSLLTRRDFEDDGRTQERELTAADLNIAGIKLGDMFIPERGCTVWKGHRCRTRGRFRWPETSLLRIGGR